MRANQHGRVPVVALRRIAFGSLRANVNALAGGFIKAGKIALLPLRLTYFRELTKKQMEVSRMIYEESTNQQAEQEKNGCNASMLTNLSTHNAHVLKEFDYEPYQSSLATDWRAELPRKQSYADVMAAAQAEITKEHTVLPAVSTPALLG